MIQAGQNRWVVGITGASGAVYGVRLCEFLLAQGYHVHLLITNAGWRVLKEELDWDVSRRLQMLEQQFSHLPGKLEYISNNDIGANVASGTYPVQGMVIVPCSMGTLAGVAAGISDNLVRRAADVMLKEGRRLILVPRETPLTVIHLDNMLRLAQMGATILPAMPAYYHQPQTLQEIVDFIVGKILHSMGIEHQLFRAWGEESI